MDEISHEDCLRIKGKDGPFGFLAEEEIEALPCFFGLRKVAAGETVWEEGEVCDYLAFVLSGTVEAQKGVGFGARRAIIGIYHERSMVGAACILDGGRRAATVVASEPSELIILSRDHLEELIESQPKLAAKLLKGILSLVSLRLRKAMERLTEVF